MFRTADFLEDNWRDANRLTAFLGAYGHQVKKPMVYQWFVRQRVPSEWAFMLLALLELEHGAPPSLTKYIQ